MDKSLFRQTMDNLQLLGHTPTKRFGQNFLIDQNTIKKFVHLAGIKKGDLVVEIGPGLGNVSDEILAYGGEVHAIELDRRLFNFLIKKYKDVPNFRVLNSDAVDSPIADLKNKPSENFEQSNFRYQIVASLPYAISTAWFDALLGCGILPDSIAIIIQLDAANRFLAHEGTKSFCASSIFIQSAYHKERMDKIGKGAFYPVPKVDSVMLFLKKRPDFYIFAARTKAIIREIFETRRKQIGTITKELERQHPNLELPLWLSQNNIPNYSRPEDIPLDTWRTLNSFIN